MIKDHNQPFPFIKSEEKESILRRHSSMMTYVYYCLIFFNSKEWVTTYLMLHLPSPYLSKDSFATLLSHQWIIVEIVLILMLRQKRPTVKHNVIDVFCTVIRYSQLDSAID